MQSVNLLIKPASSLCNLRCRYCFYEDISNHRSEKSTGIMPDSVVGTLLENVFRLVDANGAASFAFQGGEPTLAGLPFFERFAAEARRLCPARVSLHFSLQTNGTLLDEDWAAFFRRQQFLVGLSLDGYKDLHNLYRVDEKGGGSWNRTVRALRLLQKQHVMTNALCVVTAQCARHPDRAYTELKRLGFDCMQFIPCLDPIGQERGALPFSLTPERYGQFLCRLFDRWYEDWASGRYHSIRLFDDYVHLLLGDLPGTCSTCGQCGGYFVVESDGSVYPCDFFVLDQWRLGTLGRTPLAEMAAGDRLQAFFQQGSEKPAECAGCRWRRLCGGGCKNDWVSAPDPHNYFCPALQQFFAYAEDRLLSIAQEERIMRRR